MITFIGVSKQFSGVEVLKDVSFNIKPGDFVALTGPSGSGKTTFLRLISGVLKPDSGSILVNSSRIGFVFQDHRLLPWKTALENVALILRAKGIQPAEAREQAGKWLERVGIGQFANYYPAQLSGGMVQRVSIARAFSINPEIILMDEPFNNLDAELADSLLLMLQKVLADYHSTVIYVTHDMMEALRLADRLFTLGRGFREIEIKDRQMLLQEYYSTRLKAITPPEKYPE
jgi:ABC-type nitrate/sulfonate/bicarbonate transport system ATPase subunit